MKPVVGAQLYTVRDFTKTIPDIADTFRKVAEIGYTAVQMIADCHVGAVRQVTTCRRRRRRGGMRIAELKTVGRVIPNAPMYTGGLRIIRPTNNPKSAIRNRERRKSCI